MVLVKCDVESISCPFEALCNLFVKHVPVAAYRGSLIRRDARDDYTVHKGA